MAATGNRLSQLRLEWLGYLLVAALLTLAVGLFIEQATLEQAIKRAHTANSAYGYSQIERDLLKAALECRSGMVSRERISSLRHRAELGIESDVFELVSPENQRTLRELNKALHGNVDEWPCDMFAGWADQIHPLVVDATDKSNETRGELMADIRRLRQDTVAGFVTVLLLTVVVLIAERRAGRRQRRRIASLESEQEFRNRLVSMVAHELRTPVAAIGGFAELLDRDEEHRAEYADRIRRVARRLGRTINTFLDLHKLQSGQPLEIDPRPLDLRELVREAAASARAQYPQVEFELSLPEQPLVVAADEARVLAAILNLLTNAAKYGPVGEPVRVRLFCREGRARLEVEDGGPPLSPDEAAAVFEPWQRLARHRGLEGYGLGLPVVRETMERHGGELGWEARGTAQVFWLELPCL